MKVIINEWIAVAEWRWKTSDNDDDTCGICREVFHRPCPDCDRGGDDCPMIQGQCNHCFHMHCIMRWIHSNSSGNEQRCPMCRQEWRMKLL